MDRPLVTVIIPTYNCARHLRVAVASALAQDMVDFEIQVIGDGCTDESEATVKALNDPRVHWTNLPYNTGTPSAPRNKGLQQAKGRYIAYLGHDDLWFPWHLSSLLRAIGRDHHFAYSLGANYSRTGAIEGTRWAFSLPQAAEVKTALVSPSNWMLTRTFAEQIGPWTTAQATGVDKEMLLRAWAAQMRSCYAERLSVIKFPSWDWAPYADSAACPQATMLQAMQEDPQALEQRLLWELATHVARQPHRTDPVGAPRSEFSWSMLYLRAALMTAYGRQRWPLRQLINLMETRNSRNARGLAPLPPKRDPAEATRARGRSELP